MNFFKKKRESEADLEETLQSCLALAYPKDKLHIYILDDGYFGESTQPSNLGVRVRSMIERVTGVQPSYSVKPEFQVSFSLQGVNGTTTHTKCFVKNKQTDKQFLIDLFGAHSHTHTDQER